MTAKSLTKSIFGIPSLAITESMGSSDRVQALRAASFRFEAKMAETERQFQAKASELRDEYLTECAAIHEGEAA